MLRGIIATTITHLNSLFVLFILLVEALDGGIDKMNLIHQ